MNDLITSQKYLDGELSVAEKRVFEKNLECDQDLQNDIFIINELDEFLMNKDLNNFEHKIQKLIREERTRKIISLSNSIKSKYFLAASIILLMGFFLYFYINAYKPGTNRIYAQYYAKYDPDVLKRSDTSTENNYIFALEEYVNNNYDKALNMFRELMVMDDYKLIAAFYTGLCYMELNEFENALYNFQIINNSDNVIKVHSEWYSALSFLKLNNRDQAEKLLLKMVLEKGFYKDKADNILKSLE